MFAAFQSALKDVFLVTVQNEEELNCPIVATALACLVQKYAYAPRFATHRQCLESFGTGVGAGSTNSSQRPSAMELANAGFFHTGCADETVCGACFLGLRDWQPCDVDAEAVHARFATDGGNGSGCPFLTTRRLLTSVLPLARKHLTAPASRSDVASAVTMIGRLAVIAREMSASGSGGDGSGSSCWPVENARALGYSDDLILLALWRLQTEGNAADQAWEIDPQGTTDLLKAILRVQESGLGDDDCLEDVEQAVLSKASSEKTASTAENFEVGTPSGRGEAAAVSTLPRLPRFSEMVQWWAKTFLASPSPYIRSSSRRKAHSTSA